jgi:DNA/RNA-binding protein KIN17
MDSTVTDKQAPRFKLKFYCELCKKQCRDKNGFQCHQKSEGHKMLLRAYAANPEEVQERYSQEFEKNYVSLLRSQFVNRPTIANNVYIEYQRNPKLPHLNATKWSRLGEFVSYLEEKSIIEVVSGPEAIHAVILLKKENAD